MGNFIVNCWDSVMDSERNPLHHMDLATQHYFMQVLGWMWSMVFSLTFLSIYQFGITWMVHVVLFAGIAMTVSLFREAERKTAEQVQPVQDFGGASRCVWKLDTEA